MLKYKYNQIQNLDTMVEIVKDHCKELRIINDDNAEIKSIVKIETDEYIKRCINDNSNNTIIATTVLDIPKDKKAPNITEEKVWLEVKEIDCNTKIIKLSRIFATHNPIANKTIGLLVSNYFICNTFEN